MTRHERHEEQPTITVPYGEGTITFTTVEDCEIISPGSFECGSPEALIEEAFSNPIDSESFEEFVKRTEKLLVIVNDGTRPSHTSMILRYIHPVISTHADVHYLIAAGTHSPPDETGLIRIFGNLLSELREIISSHEARNEGELETVGMTSRGTKVILNRKIMRSDGIICIGNIKPHYFAGFAGGRKSIIPGCAGFSTIEQNHSLALDPGAQPMALNGNPLAQDLEEGVRLLGDKRIFSIQTVDGPDHGLTGVFCGNIHTSFTEATVMAREIHGVPVRSKANIIVTANPFPMDINLYQSQHALENVQGVVEEGGIIILVSKCWDGTGNPAYLEQLDNGGGLEEMEQKVGEEGYRLGDHKAVRFLRMAEKAELWAVTDLDDDTIRRSRMNPSHDLQQAVDDAISIMRERGRTPRILVFPNGGMTVSYLDYRG